MLEQITERKEIEMILLNKFKDRKNENFLLKNPRSGEDEIIEYFEMIENLSVIVQQNLWDDDMSLDHIDDIEKRTWDKWLDSFDMQQNHCRCCRYTFSNICLKCDF